jgi:hypothetical protein
MVTLQLRTPVSHVAVIDGPDVTAFAVRETTPAAAPKPRFLDRVREAIRTRHDSRRTEKTYVAWIRRYLFFHGKRHPADMGAAEITQFLSALAVQDHVAASTQNQALSARSGPSVFPSSSAAASERFSVSFTERRTCR